MIWYVRDKDNQIIVLDDQLIILTNGQRGAGPNRLLSGGSPAEGGLDLNPPETMSPRLEEEFPLDLLQGTKDNRQRWREESLMWNTDSLITESNRTPIPGRNRVTNSSLSLITHVIVTLDILGVLLLFYSSLLLPLACFYLLNCIILL